MSGETDEAIQDQERNRNDEPGDGAGQERYRRRFRSLEEIAGPTANCSTLKIRNTGTQRKRPATRRVCQSDVRKAKETPKGQAITQKRN